MQSTSLSNRVENMALSRTIFFIVLATAGLKIRRTSALVPWRNDTSAVCKVTISHRESRYVPYTETYRSWGMYRVRTRINYKIQYFTTWTTEERCCDGYENNDNVCKPFCLHICENSVCSKPQFCECFTGFVKSSDPNEYYVCTPHCTNPCINGYCAHPEHCVCNGGFRMTDDNYTCVPYCKPGYEVPPGSLTCEPVCHQDCGKNNGICTAPDECDCKKGYVKNNNTEECQPVCDRPCGNGTCINPQVCECHSGYGKSNDSNDPFVCVPQCMKPCVHGICTQPEVCTCDKDYRLNADNHTCEPICDPPCGNGSCIKPRVCECYPGYGTSNDTNDHSVVCVPQCTKACIHGTCTEPEVCTCDKDYQLTVDNHTCEPICDPACTNGKCVAPNECICHVGFAKNASNYCLGIGARNCSGRGMSFEEEDCICEFGSSGSNCENITVCVVSLDFADGERVTPRKNISDGLVELYQNAPHCNQCNGSLDNETLCYIVHSDDRNDTIGCFLDIGMSCYAADRYDAVTKEMKTAGSFGIVITAVVISIITIAAGTTYLLVRRYQRRKLCIVNTDSSLPRGQAGTESLLSEEAVYL